MNLRVFTDSVAGLLLCIIAVLKISQEWGVAGWSEPVTPFLVLGLIAIFVVQVRLSRKAFVLVGFVLSVVLAATNPDWRVIVTKGLSLAAFIGAFFAALSTIRTAARTSLAIQHAGTFLAEQKPGRRYAALTLGGQAFTLVLNYGSIQLLGALTIANSRTEPDAEIRDHRIRRMLLAIQRAFVSSMPWSPLSFTMAIAISVIPGASWTQALLPGMVSSFILAGTGWGLDAMFKPRLAKAPTHRASSQTWKAMLPLLALLAVLAISLITLHNVTDDVPITGLVAVLVPTIALVWTVIQHWTDGPVRNTGARIKSYALNELPNYRGELTLLMMAGFIGTVGSQLLPPIVLNAGVDVLVFPPWLVILSFVWIIPLAGQIGMNPIMTVTLIAPLIPEAAQLGVQPTALVTAITAGWALSGASSPFTATTLLIGSFAGINALRVGLVWNGLYVLVAGLGLSMWVLVYSFLL